MWVQLYISKEKIVHISLVCIYCTAPKFDNPTLFKIFMQLLERQEVSTVLEVYQQSIPTSLHYYIAKWVSSSGWSSSFKLVHNFTRYSSWSSHCLYFNHLPHLWNTLLPSNLIISISMKRLKKIVKHLLVHQTLTWTVCVLTISCALATSVIQPLLLFVHIISAYQQVYILCQFYI